MKWLMRLIATLAVGLSGVSCDRGGGTGHPRKHELVGAWQAADGTIFIFRNDGTFHGVDFRKREIWGNWVELSEERIGFQSLLHDSYYAPQYATSDPKDPQKMDFIVSGGTHFIRAERIGEKHAQAAVERIAAPGIHRP